VLMFAAWFGGVCDVRSMERLCADFVVVGER
jgi:hypothetical protein